NRDYSKVEVNLNITEGDQYFTGKLDVKSADGHELLFDKEKMIDGFKLKTGEVFNIYNMNEGRYKISDIYLEQGYAFSKVGIGYNTNEETKTVDVTLNVTKGEKAYIGRVEIQGNYETLDSVIRRELKIHDNELYNGVKLRESRSAITALGFFKPSTGVRFEQSQGEEENTLDYGILLEEGQTGTFSASLTYSGESGMAIIASISKKNFLGTGKTLTFSTEQKGEGEGSRYDFSMVNPYWFDTEFTNSFRVFSILEVETYYDTRTSGFNYGLSYPIWKNWNLSSNFSWKDEYYSNIGEEYGEELLDGTNENTYRSLSLGLSYSTVDHPLFPSNGFETSFYSEQYGGLVLGGSIEYQVLNLNTRFFKPLNSSGSIVFGAKFNWAQLLQTNSSIEIPSHIRYTIGGITSVRGFDWNEIRGPASTAELNGFDIADEYPTERESYMDTMGFDESTCSGDATCDAKSTTKNESREYFEQHFGGITKRVLNLQMYFPLTREGGNIRGLIFFDMGNVWAEDRMYKIAGLKKDDWYYRTSIGTGVNLITPMGVLRFEYGIKLDKKEGESASKFDFHISGLF
ncbi:outer membrane protein assembly factor BamA, partial [bacterium]|nr:outer membrane protein assembly factor BamA [bacterium]